MKESFIPGPHAWYHLGGKPVLCGDYGRRHVVIADGQTRDAETGFLVPLSGDEPQGRLLGNAWLLLARLQETHAALCIKDPTYVGSEVHRLNQEAIEAAGGKS